MPATKEGELEELREINHRLKLNLESTKQLHSIEVEYLKEELQIKEKDCKVLEEKLRTQSKKKATDGEVASLTAAYDAALEENTDLKTQIEHQQRTIDQLKLGQTQSVAVCQELESLKTQNDKLNIELANTRDLLEIQLSKVQTLTQQAIQNVGLLDELRQELENRDSYISELHSRVKELENDKQEAIMDLQTCLASQQNARQEAEDPTRRGNSLFSEVDERRQKVEEEMCRLRERIVRLTAEKHELKSQVDRVNARSGMILRQVQIIEKNEADVVKEFNKLQSETIPIFMQHRDKIEALKCEYKRKLVQYRDGVFPPTMGEVEALREERDLLLSQKIGIEQEIFDLRKELAFASSKVIDSDARIMIYRTKLQAFQEGVITGGAEGSPTAQEIRNGSLQNGCSDSSDANGNRRQKLDGTLNTTQTSEVLDQNQQQKQLSTHTKSASDVHKSRSSKWTTDQKELADCNQQ